MVQDDTIHDMKPKVRKYIVLKNPTCWDRIKADLGILPPNAKIRIVRTGTEAAQNGHDSQPGPTEVQTRVEGIRSHLGEFTRLDRYNAADRLHEHLSTEASTPRQAGRSYGTVPRLNEDLADYERRMNRTLPPELVPGRDTSARARGALPAETSVPPHVQGNRRHTGPREPQQRGTRPARAITPSPMRRAELLGSFP